MNRWQPLVLIFLALSACTSDQLETSDIELPLPPIVESGPSNNGWFGVGGSELRTGIPMQYPELVAGQVTLQPSGDPTLFLVDGNPAVAMPLRGFLPSGENTRAVQLTRFDGERWRTFRVDAPEGDRVVIRGANYDGNDLSLLVFDFGGVEGRYGVATFDAETNSFDDPVWSELEGGSSALSAHGRWKLVFQRAPDELQVLQFVDGEWSSDSAQVNGQLQSLSEDGEFALLQNNETTDGPTRVTLELWNTTTLERALLVEPEEVEALLPEDATVVNTLGVYSGDETYISWAARGSANPIQQFFSVERGGLVERSSLSNAWAQARFAGVVTSGGLVAATSYNGPGQADIRVVSLTGEQLVIHDRDVPGGGGISNSQDIRSGSPQLRRDGERVCALWSEGQSQRLLCNDDLAD